MKEQLDKWGITLSALCAVHCIVTPFVFLLPSVQVFQSSHHHWIHFVFFIFVAPLAFGTLILRKTPLAPKIIGSVGLFFLFCALMTTVFHINHNHEWDIALSLAGSFCLVFAHYKSIKTRRVLKP